MSLCPGKVNLHSIVFFVVDLICIGAFPQLKKSKWNKWKNHFSQIKGDVGMKKKGNKKMPIPRQEVIDNPIPTSLYFF